MDYIGILLTGYDLNVCKKLANKLISESTEIEKFVPVLCETDSVELCSVEGYISICAKKNLIYYSNTSDLKLEESGNRFIIKIDNIKEKYRSGYIPIIIVPDEFLRKFISCELNKNIMTIKIDDIKSSTDSSLKLYNKCTYRITLTDYDDVCTLIAKLWKHRECGGALSKDMILQMVKCNMLIRNGDIENVSYASYDLSLGDEYYYNGKVRALDNSQPFIPIEPYDYIIASTKEMIAFPRDVVGRFDLVVGLFFEGIILSNSTQVDPGFNGKLFCLLFNTSNKTVYLKRGMKFSTIEFNKLIEPTEAYNGTHAYEESMVSYLPRNIMNGAINELKKDVEKLRTENAKMQQLYVASLAIMIAVLALKVIGG